MPSVTFLFSSQTIFSGIYYQIPCVMCEKERETQYFQVRWRNPSIFFEIYQNMFFLYFLHTPRLILTTGTRNGGITKLESRLISFVKYDSTTVKHWEYWCAYYLELRRVFRAVFNNNISRVSSPLSRVTERIITTAVKRRRYYHNRDLP